MRHPFPDQRIVRGATDAVLSHQFHDADGDPAAPAGTVTVAVTRSDGTAVSVGSVSVPDPTSDPYTVTIAQSELATIDRLTAVWSDDGTAVATTEFEVVGGTVGSLTAIAAVESSLSNDVTSNAAGIKAARKAAEDRFLSVTNRSPFERLVVERFDGTGHCYLWGATLPDLQSVRWVRVYTNATTYTEFTAAELAAIDTPDVYARFERTDGKAWPCGRRNIEIAYTAGLTAVPEDLRRAFFRAIRSEFTSPTTGVPERASSWGSADGITFGIATPGQRGAIYGIPELDAVWNKYADPRPMVA